MGLLLYGGKEVISLTPRIVAVPVDAVLQCCATRPRGPSRIL